MEKMINICIQKNKMLSVIFFIFLFCIVWYGFNNTVFAADYYSGDYSCTIIVYNDTYGGSDHYTTTWHLYSDNEICGYYDDGGISKIYSLSGYSGNYIAIDNDTGAEFRTGTYSGNNSTFSKIYPNDLSITCKFFQTYDDMIEYFETGDDSGQINKPQIDITDKDKQDTAYSLTGFTADKTINASWTGTTQRSNMTDVDVEEFVRCVVGYGYKEAPGQIATTKQLDVDYPIADLGCTVLWDDIQPDDDSIFVRYVSFYPYYSGSDGIFGSYYYGNPSTVYFDNTGKVIKVTGSTISTKHNFNNDLVDKSIPLPVLSNISHNGFTVDNVGDYYVDIYVESTLYGVKFLNNGNAVFSDINMSPDLNWKYAEYKYNLVDNEQRAFNQNVFSLPDDFNIDNLDNLLSSFKSYCQEYPNANDLPTFNWTYAGAVTNQYSVLHSYKNKSDDEFLTCLDASGQAETIFYVRFYDQNINCGQWAKYTLRGNVMSYDSVSFPDSSLSSGSVSFDSDGRVVIDSAGNPVVNNEISGTVNHDTGDISYVPSNFDPSDLGDVTLNFFTTLSNMLNSLGQFPAMISSVFGFLPDYFINFLFLSLTLIIILRVLGR